MNEYNTYIFFKIDNHTYLFSTIENFFAQFFQLAAAVTGTKFSFCVSLVGAVEVSGDVWIQNDSKIFVKLV